MCYVIINEVFSCANTTISINLDRKDRFDTGLYNCDEVPVSRVRF